MYEHDVPDELEILFLPGAYKNYLNLIDEAHGSFLWNIVKASTNGRSKYKVSTLPKMENSAFLPALRELQVI